MSDTYSSDGEDTTDVRPATRTPYRGPRVRSRSTGEVYYWNGTTYIPQNDRRRLTAPEQQTISAAEAAAQNYQQHMPDLNRFEELNRTVPTGSLSHRAGQFLGNLPRLLSIDNQPGPGSSTEGYEEMRAINSRLTPDQREPGSGSSSNLDVTMFREGLPNLGNSGPANSRIIAGARRQAQDAQDYADFLNWYWPRTGSTNNAQAEFQRFRTARQRNPNLRWREFFSAEQQQPQRGSGATPRRPPGVPAEAQWDAARRRWVAD